ncbi:hypothetical protein SBV1_280015 [Verrucomicrobia bacterium]|nr:hypothetical protein SBV1_280015 [Verrucomicrobiota bacterium]
MRMHDLPDSPRLQVQVQQFEMQKHNRWSPGYFDGRYRQNERELRKLQSVPLGNFIPEELPDGSLGITYGQVGARKLSPHGSVRYLQVINIRDTGIDFAIKPDRIAEGSHNDPARSRVESEDILFTNNAFRGTETLIGRCIVLARDYGKLNISQHIDRVRVTGINPFYVCCFLKSRFGWLQVQRVMHGVDAMTISFGRIRAMEIPPLPSSLQSEVERQYRDMSKMHDRDYLIHQGDVPLVTIEGEPHARQFDQGFKQAKNYSRNFKPRQQGCPMQEGTVPFVITAAGNRAEMWRAVVRGLNIEYEPIRQSGAPAFLEWRELLAEAGQARRAKVISPQQQVLVADLAHQFFADLFASIDHVRALRNKEDQKIILFNDIIDHARKDGEASIGMACRRTGLRAPAIRRVLRTIGWYRQKIESQELSGAAVARGYRTFLLQPGGRGTHRFFTGESQSRAYRIKGVVRYRNVARYFTPTEITQQMVRLAQPRARELVIDMTCGTGGFLAESVAQVAEEDGDATAQQFLAHHLVGIDDDPFCVSCARELLTFLYPHCAGHLQVFLHNALYQRAPSQSEIDEDPRAERHLRPGQYDLVIGNPPGNAVYSGTNREEVARQWEERFGHLEGGLMDHNCFLRRALELARPDGGRVCLLVPEGLLSRDNRALPDLRSEVASQCEIRLIVSLPRVFKDNNARMAILFLVRRPRPNSKCKVSLVELPEKWRDSDDREQTTDLFGELEAAVSDYLGGPGA